MEDDKKKIAPYPQEVVEKAGMEYMRRKEYANLNLDKLIAFIKKDGFLLSFGDDERKEIFLTEFENKVL